jgi:hypothetical protein
MELKNLKKNQYVRIVSIAGALKENKRTHSQITSALGNVFRVDTTSDSLEKCILHGLGGVIFPYEDLQIAKKEDNLPKGGTFDVKNLVVQKT